MSKAEPGINAGMEFFSDTLQQIMASSERLSAESLAVVILEKMIADGVLELQPGCTKEKTAAMFTGAFRNLKLKIPANL